MLVKTFLLLGTNLGDREKQLQSAIQKITIQIGSVIQVSSIYETEPWGSVQQPNYLNQVVAIETTLSVEKVLEKALSIEQELGRIREVKWGARIIDIDVLYYGQETRQSESLTLPHPFLHVRRFTLIPLVEIAPDWQHPVLHLTNQALLERCPDKSDVNIFTPSNI
jgi:2-amino-4-hydroxy-6-hydroxymethyldihydropteridine diphosphokinase